MLLNNSWCILDFFTRGDEKETFIRIVWKLLVFGSEFQMLTLFFVKYILTIKYLNLKLSMILDVYQSEKFTQNVFKTVQLINHETILKIMNQQSIKRYRWLNKEISSFSWSNKRCHGVIRTLKFNFLWTEGRVQWIQGVNLLLITFFLLSLKN